MPLRVVFGAGMLIAVTRGSNGKPSEMLRGLCWLGAASPGKPRDGVRRTRFPSL